MKQFSFGKASSFPPAAALEITFSSKIFRRFFKYKIAQLQMAASKFDSDLLMY